MLLIPAIDLKDGHCVRLKQGDMDQATTFSEDPAAMARSWLDKGARRLHLVDLNGAFAGKPQNFAAIKSILKAVGDDIPVQLGGGIRDLDTIEKYIDGGLRYVIIGTAAVKNPGFLKDACTAFGGHIIVGPGCQGRQGRHRRLEQADRPRGGRPGAQVRGLGRRIHHLHRHRPRRHAHRHQHRGHGQAGAGAAHSGDRLRRAVRTWPTSKSSARWRTKASRA